MPGYPDAALSGPGRRRVVVGWQDVYLHTNCLAALANMGPHVQNLNSYASQRLVSLFDMLARK